MATALDSLAPRIRAETEAADRDWHSALAHAIRAGELLIEAKSQCKHGTWLPWLETNGFDHHRVSEFMRIAKIPDAGNLPSIRVALKMCQSRYQNCSGEFEWYTPVEITEAAIAVMGGIDLDPASCTKANEVVRAATFYTLEDDGLSREWRGRVWMNPPYAQPLIGQFVDKLVASENVTEWITLTNNATETVWFQTLSTAGDAVCFPKGRISFWHPERRSNTPQQGQAFVYFGPRRAEFVKRFGSFGWAGVTS